MGGKKRGKNRETVTVEQGARNENEKEKEEVDLFDWYMLGMGEVKEMEDGDLFDGCFFLVRANSSKTIPTTTTETSISNRSLCHQEDFHYIDLVLKFTIPYYLPSIINCIGTGTMLSFNNSEVFILGDQSQPLFQHNHDVDNPIHKHTGASLISPSQCSDWEPFLSPGTNKMTVNPAVLSDKIYSFGYPFLRPRVYHPKPSNLWNTLLLPVNLVQTHVSFPLLPDPLNNRIIFHLPLMSMLYAFYPDEKKDADKWKQLASNFNTWNYIAVAIADNIIFFHPEDVYDRRDLLLAYDMNTSTWLRIVWDFSNIDNFLIVYDAIFTLSNKGLMCLASGICGSSVQFLRFRVKRTSDTHLKLTAIDYHKYNIPSATRISDIIFF
ncbi:uncharacterized protein LOC141591025 isoform X1 [Silene latifolia]|uniref:uncharacterized protein LOC141591025 isoform X1 n=1 Tax=Silene latifolia TaxID=37657 RepID=UPI003D77DBC1